MGDDRIQIRGKKDGIYATIDSERFDSFEEMKVMLIKKLSVGKAFYKDATLTIDINTKSFSDENIAELKGVLFDEIGIKNCIFDKRETNESKQAGEDKNTKTFSGVYEGKTKFIRKTVRGGQEVDFPGNIVIIGNVNSGAEIKAAGNVIVLGTVKGRVRAGSNGNTKAIIAAISLQPEILQIGDILTISPDDAEKPSYPEVAKIKDNTIMVEPYLPNKY